MKVHAKVLEFHVWFSYGKSADPCIFFIQLTYCCRVMVPV